MLAAVIVNKSLFNLFYQLTNSLRGGLLARCVEWPEKEGGTLMGKKLEETSKAIGRIPGPSPGEQFLECLRHLCSSELFSFFSPLNRREDGALFFSGGSLAYPQRMAFPVRRQGSGGFLPSVPRPRQQVNKRLINDLFIYCSWRQDWTSTFGSRL